MPLRLRAMLLGLAAAFPSSVNNAPARPAGTGRPLDWWYDDMAGTLYTLVVEAR